MGTPNTSLSFSGIAGIQTTRLQTTNQPLAEVRKDVMLELF